MAIQKDSKRSGKAKKKAARKPRMNTPKQETAYKPIQEPKTVVLLSETIDYSPVIVKALRAIPDDINNEIRRSKQLAASPKANTSVAHNIAVLHMTIKLLKMKSLKEQVEFLREVIEEIEDEILLDEEKERGLLDDL